MLMDLHFYMYDGWSGLIVYDGADLNVSLEVKSDRICFALDS